jgi:2-polyprenyl-3-methyl-5-hydroxy-6-metoxy-1,4-benzoquinol methylase
VDCCSPGDSPSDSPGDSPFDRQFDADHAVKHLRAYHDKGATGLTRALIDALAEGGAQGRTVLDIGGGVGVVHHELLRSGAASAIDVDASTAYVAAARAEAERQGHADRVRYLTGDFVSLADDVPPADLVALDRVICCYEDMAALVARSAALATHRYGLVFPRDTILGRIGVALLNLELRVSRSPFRVFLHRTAEVDAILAAQGFTRRQLRQTLGWQLAIYERTAA